MTSQRPQGVIRKVARMGHPVLRVPARELSREEIFAPQTAQLVADLISTMEEYGGIGLAAPQIHVSLAVAVIQFRGKSTVSRYGSAGSTLFINPKITVTNPDEQGFGKVSVPDLKVGLSSVRIRVDYLTTKPAVLEASGPSTVIQHELIICWPIMWIGFAISEISRC